MANSCWVCDKWVLLWHSDTRSAVRWKKVELVLGMSFRDGLLRAHHGLRKLVHAEARILGEEREIVIALRLVKLQDSILGRNGLWCLGFLLHVHLLLDKLGILLSLCLLAHALSAVERQVGGSKIVGG